MTYRTLFERDSLIVADYPGPECISAAHRSHLARLEPHLPKGSLNWSAKGLRLGSHCGILRVGDETIEILPKIFRGDQAAATNREILLHLMKLTGTLPWLKNWQASNRLQSDHLLDIFIQKFCDDLHSVLKGGMARSYREHHSEISVVRGKLDLIDLTRRMPGSRHKVVCRFDEFDEDIPLNRLFRHCIEKLCRIVRSHSIRRALEELRFRFDGVSPIQYRPTLLKEVRLDRPLAHFQEVWMQCKWLLQGLYPDIVAGGDPHASLLFDMEKLFENAVFRKATQELAPGSYGLKAQGPRQFLLSHLDEGIHRRHMKPDISITSPSGRKVILDCKWKLLEDTVEADVISNITSSDLYQLHTYATEYKAGAVGFVFPWVTGLPEKSIEMRYRGIDIPVWIHFANLDVFKPGMPGNLTGQWLRMFD